MLSNSSHLTLPLSLFPCGTTYAQKISTSPGLQRRSVRSTAWRTADDKGKHGVFFTNDTYPYDYHHLSSIIPIIPIVGYGHAAKCVNAWNGIAKIGAMIFVWPVLDTH